MPSHVLDPAYNWHMNGANFFNLFLYGMKFDMVRLDTYNDNMGGFPNSNMIHTNNSTIKQQAYRIINVNGANVENFPICACMD